MDIAQLISEYGFPIVATVGLLYMIYFIWQFITNEIKSKLGETIGTLIELMKWESGNRLEGDRE